MLKKREEQENINFFTNVYILAFALKKSEWPFATLAWEVFPTQITPPLHFHP